MPLEEWLMNPLVNLEDRTHRHKGSDSFVRRKKNPLDRTVDRGLSHFFLVCDSTF